MVLVDTLGGSNVPGASPGTQALPLELEIARGAVPGCSTHVVRGHTASVAAAAGSRDIWVPGGAATDDLVYLTSATTIEITSDSSSDSSSFDGMRTLLVQGIANLGSAQTEIITLNGTTDVLTTNQYYRVNALVGLTAGDSGWNVGDIRASSGSAGIQCQMEATHGISENSHYTVPLGATFHVTKLELNVAKESGGQEAHVNFQIYIRPGGAGASWLRLFDKAMDTEALINLDVDLPFPSSNTQATERSDFRGRIETDQNGTQARTRMYGYLIDN